MAFTVHESIQMNVLLEWICDTSDHCEVPTAKEAREAATFLCERMRRTIPAGISPQEVGARFPRRSPGKRRRRKVGGGP